MENIIKYKDAVQAIKTAILQGQYEAAKGVNRIQLAVCFSIGKYISTHTRIQAWGTHALEFISDQLRKELPGLRGFSATQLREMRLFYESWQMFDSNPAVATAEAIVPEIRPLANSSVATDEFQTVDKQSNINSSVVTDELIDIHHSIVIRNASFPVEDFFKVPFTHHSRIISGVKELQDRYYYIHRTAEEHLSVEKLKQLIKGKAHEHQGDMPNNFARTIFDQHEARKAVMMFKDEYLLMQILDDKVRKPHENPSIGIILCQEADHAYAEYAIRDYTKPMGVATYKTLDDMPEHIRKALPDMEKMMALLSK